MTPQPPVDVVTENPEVLDAPELKDNRFLRKVKRVIGKVGFVRHAVAMWHAWKDDETPLWAKALIVGALVYFVTPFDLISDVFVGIGYTDDAAIIMAAVKALSDHIKPAHYAAADAWLERQPVAQPVDVMASPDAELT